MLSRSAFESQPGSTTNNINTIDMIDAKSLRVGNKFLCGRLSVEETVYQITYDRMEGYLINGAYPEKDCNPIPLTPELLIACGFSHEEKESRTNDMKVFHVYTKGSYTFNSSHGWWFNGKQLDNQPKYLHQLQNLYFATEAEELTYTQLTQTIKSGSNTVTNTEEK